ncbi:hypothetical protein NE237_018925 [Protea cynaroides]|uniref:S-protein homolog n=1 Tax=Protea cynaroides TaxID=273540 RepID=A0A9Q0KAB3_9MAGN|nr:hypothetical protein NE237_018608 [Protea cynaroides]KAJ4967076.1 hypothetical protein NE237_018925 [Protea cynaroides]
MIPFNNSKHGMMVSLILILMWLSEFSSIVDAKRHVRIINELDEGLTLTVHCQSKDDDLGVHQLAYNTSFDWGFNDNWWGTTLFYCHIEWLHGKKDFDAYNARKQQCVECWWTAKTDALYYLVYETGQTTTYEWQR